MENKFSLQFGQLPQSYIYRKFDLDRITDDFSLDFPLSRIYIICGVRGSGKTVLLTDVGKRFSKKEEWIVVDVNPNRSILEQIASGIYETESVKHLFLSASFSFHGLGFSIQGKTPVSNIKTILEKMLSVVKKHNKKVLITIDEVSNNGYMRSFAHDFQSLLREDYPIYTVMTGLYENVNSLQNNKNLTFLYRAPKRDLKPLNIDLVKEEYRVIFEEESSETIDSLANLTKGYAFAYQVVGYLFSKYKDIDKIYNELDQYLSVYVYEKIWSNLPTAEKKILKTFVTDTNTTEVILKATAYSSKVYSVYRDRLIKHGLVTSYLYGELKLVLPRFENFIVKQPQ